MKKSALLTVVLATWNAQAQQSELRTQFQAAQPAETISASSSQARFGAYQLESELVVVPTTIADPNQVELSIATLSITRSKTGSPEVAGFSKNAVVRHLLTGELGVLTGHVLLQLKAGTDLEKLSNHFGLTVIKKVEDTDLVIVMPKAEQDLVQLTNQLRSSGLLKQVQLDILDNRNKPW